MLVDTGIQKKKKKGKNVLEIKYIFLTKKIIHHWKTFT